jgi:hypothetical protein
MVEEKRRSTCVAATESIDVSGVPMSGRRARADEPGREALPRISPYSVVAAYALVDGGRLGTADP